MLSRNGQKSVKTEKESNGVPHDPEISESRFFIVYLEETLEKRVLKNRGLKTAIMQWSSCPRMSIECVQKKTDF